MSATFREAADAVFEEMLERLGEAEPQPRLYATARALEFLGDPHRSFPIIHLTGTNGKTSTARMIESILRAHGLRTGLFTSPHLQRFTERMVVDGEPVSDEKLVENWNDIKPYLEMADDELVAAGEPKLTFFEVLTVLAYAIFADAPVDVGVIEVGMGGAWDSTNVADGQIAVFTTISLDHMNRLGNTIAEIAHTKAGIIKSGATVISSKQLPDAAEQLAAKAKQEDAALKVEGEAFSLLGRSVAVGGQLISVRGLAAQYDDVPLPLHGEHQAHNAAAAIAAVEAFLGNGSQALTPEVLTEGMLAATSPGRLQLIGNNPPVVLDAAHNPGGAHSLATALNESFHFDEICFVMAILRDKDAAGVIAELTPLATRFIATQSVSDRARNAGVLAEDMSHWSSKTVEHFDGLRDALAEARSWASEARGRGVVVTGSITLLGEALDLAEQEGWRSK